MNRRDALKSAGALGLLSFGLVPHRAILAQHATPASDGTEATLEGLLASNIDILPTADSGEIQIVLQSAPFEQYVGLIIHNNSHKTVGNKGIIGVARDTDNKLIGVTRIHHVAPYEIGPGQYSIGVATFDRELAADTTIELAPEFEEIDPERGGYVDLAVTEVSIMEEEVIGIVENQTETNAAGIPFIVGLFLDDSGEIAGLARPYLADSDVAAGSTATFSERLDGRTVTEPWLFAASGREER